eukprot:scaffold7031_cov254-Pinguiococcus_pyrenoidosus.AAC.1
MSCCKAGGAAKRGAFAAVPANPVRIVALWPRRLCGLLIYSTALSARRKLDTWESFCSAWRPSRLANGLGAYPVRSALYY